MIRQTQNFCFYFIYSQQKKQVQQMSKPYIIIKMLHNNNLIISWQPMMPYNSFTYFNQIPMYYYICPYVQMDQCQPFLAKDSVVEIQNFSSDDYPNIKQQQNTATVEEDEISSIQKSNHSKKIKKQVTKFLEEGGESSEFNPKKFKEGLQKKKLKSKQNQNRNVIPNIIHQAFSFIGKQKKSQILIRKLFQYFPAPQFAKIGRFYLYQKKIKEKMNHYLSEDSLGLFNRLVEPDCQIYSKEEQQYYLKISRVMITHFLRNSSPLVTLTSKRMSKAKRLQHLHIRQYLLSKLEILFQ